MASVIFTAEELKQINESTQGYSYEMGMSQAIPAELIGGAGAVLPEMSGSPITYRYEVDKADPTPETGHIFAELQNAPSTLKNYVDFDLISKYAGISLEKSIMNLGNTSLIERNIRGKMGAMMSAVEFAIFTGATGFLTSDSGTNGAVGIMNRATAAAAPDATIDSVDDILGAIDNLFAGVASRFRSQPNGWLLYMTPGVMRDMKKYRNSTTGESALSIVKRDYMDANNAIKGEQIKGLYATNYLVNATPSASAQYMLLIPNNVDLCARVISFPLGFVGDEYRTVTYNATIGWRGAGIVKEATAVTKTDALTTSTA